MKMREFLLGVEKGGIPDAQAMAHTLRENGYIAHEFVDHRTGAFTPEMTIRWFLGQGIAIVDEGAYFAMNSWINCIEKYVPEDLELEKLKRELFDPKLFEV
jgi:hypothetical protein